MLYLNNKFLAPGDDRSVILPDAPHRKVPSRLLYLTGVDCGNATRSMK